MARHIGIFVNEAEFWEIHPTAVIAEAQNTEFGLKVIYDLREPVGAEAKMVEAAGKFKDINDFADRHPNAEVILIGEVTGGIAVRYRELRTLEDGPIYPRKRVVADRWGVWAQGTELYAAKHGGYTRNKSDALTTSREDACIKATCMTRVGRLQWVAVRL